MPKSVSDVLKNLDYLAGDFNQKAEAKAAGDKRVAAALEAAAQTIKDLQQQVNTLQLASLKQENVKGKDFTFLIDGSGSMGTGRGSSTPLKESLESATAFSKATEANVTVGLWGDSDTPVIVVNDANLKAVEKGLNCGTNFLPAAGYMQAAAAATKKAQHFVIFSDGDAFDQKASLEKLQQMLKASPKASVDFALLTNNNGSNMEKLAGVLQKEFPQQVGIYHVTAGGSLSETLKIIAAKRTQPAKAKKSSQPKVK